MVAEAGFINAQNETLHYNDRRRFVDPTIRQVYRAANEMKLFRCYKIAYYFAIDNYNSWRYFKPAPVPSQPPRLFAPIL